MSQDWMKPNDLIKQHRLKQKRRKNNTNEFQVSEIGAKSGNKRRNSSTLLDVSKKRKTDQNSDSESTSLESKGAISQENPPSTNDNCVYYRNVPVDWNIKIRARFFCKSEIHLTNLTDRHFAKGLISFVRSIESDNAADTPLSIQLNQASYYWQYPHLPWITLFPRKSKENSDFVLGERERNSLLNEWHHSFRGLFQLLRAQQCPYFYLCANTFTVLFRAAKVGGCNEIHSLMSPTAIGMRRSLQQEGIEFSMPLRKENSEILKTENELVESDIVDIKTEEEDEEEEEWLRSLGVNENEIRKINTIDKRQMRQKDTETDFYDDSTVLIQGIDCQAFFNFLLNAKSTITQTGRLAGVPPTLLSPIAFPKATLENLSVSTKKLFLDGEEFFSFEMKGIILPTVIQQICAILTKAQNTFSATFASHHSTYAFAKVAHNTLSSANKLIKSDSDIPEYWFTKEVTEAICQIDTSFASVLEQVRYDKNNGYSLN